MSTAAPEKKKKMRLGRMARCRAGKTEIRYCRLLKLTLENDRAVETAFQWSTGAVFVVYVQKAKGKPFFVWTTCPYCGELLTPKVACKDKPKESRVR